jgi:glycosyltransferase involved in cell wall biosynthesis
VKILLSAFACEPNRGSELGVGWNWALSLGQAGHTVVVLTRSISRLAIEQAMKKEPRDLDLRFEYFDVPKPLRWQTRGPLHLHAMLWQWRAAAFAGKLHDRYRFDCVHHVTFAGLRSPIFMGRLGIPFILGPVGGGERAPWRLRHGYSLSGLAFDAARDVANHMIRYTPFMNDMFTRAERIYVTSPETMRIMPRRFRDKAQIELAIGAEEPGAPPAAAVRQAPRTDASFRVLYAGRFIDCKGMHIGLPSFARLARAVPGARLTMVGEGPAGRRWRRLAEELGIASMIDWLPWQERAAMTKLYADHDVLLFPAMHDSGGTVVLEAMNYGLPTVCLKLGGPATLVNESCGHAVDPAGKTVAEVAAELGEALIALSPASARAALAVAAKSRCREFSWREKVTRIHGLA